MAEFAGFYLAPLISLIPIIYIHFSIKQYDKRCTAGEEDCIHKQFCTFTSLDWWEIIKYIYKLFKTRQEFLQVLTS